MTTSKTFSPDPSPQHRLESLRRALDEHAIVAVTDPEGIITFVNEKFCEISEYSEAELLGKNHRILSSGTHPKPFFKGMWDTILAGRVWQGQICNRAKTGRLYWVDTTIVPSLLKDGSPYEFIAIRRDISRQKRIEQDLRSSLDLQARLVESARLVRAACWFQDDDRVMFTDSITSILGGTPRPEGWLQEELLERVHPEERPLCAQALSARGPRLRTFDCRIRGGSEEWVWMRWHLAGSAMQGGVVQDITEERRLQSQLLQAQKMESLGAMAAGMAHDIRNVLQAIEGHAEILDRGAQQDERAHRHLQSICQAVERAQAQTKKLLIFSRDEPVHMTLADPSLLVEEVAALMRPTMGLSIRLLTEVAPDLPATLLDLNQIHQVLVDLILNAKAAISDKGTITLSARAVMREDHRQGGGADPSERFLVLEVTDTGAGIPSEILPHIFEPFFTTKGEKGTGLGLSVAYGIAQAHGGWLECDSTPGEGTTIGLYLPIGAQMEEEPLEAQSAS